MGARSALMLTGRHGPSRRHHSNRARPRPYASTHCGDVFTSPNQRPRAKAALDELRGELTLTDRRKVPGAVEARPTLVSDDVSGGRSFWQYTSETQQPPKGDNRQRVTHSAKFYVVQLIGTWVNVSESAERTIHYRNRLRWVRFENREYQLRKSEHFKPFLRRFIQGGCYAYVGGKDLFSEHETENLQSEQFIYIASSEALKIFNELRRARGQKPNPA